jgi:hypothetical protein
MNIKRCNMSISIAKLNFNKIVSEEDCILAIYVYQNFMHSRFDHLNANQLNIKLLNNLSKENSRFQSNTNYPYCIYEVRFHFY